MSHSKISKGSVSPTDDSDDEWAKDIVLVSKSGTRYPAAKALLVAKSSVFRDMIAGCVFDTAKDGSSSKVDEVQLEDEDAEIQALVEHLHRPDRFLKAVMPKLTKNGAQNIKSLTSIAFKYNMKGVLRQVEAYLSMRAVLEAFTAHHGDTLDTWLFACRYHLKDLLLEVEDLVQSQPRHLNDALSKSSSRLLELSCDSQSVALSSLARILQGTSAKLLTVAKSCESALSSAREVTAKYPHFEQFFKDVFRVLEEAVQSTRDR